MSQVERAEFAFVVYEGSVSRTGVDDAPVSIAFEPRTSDLPTLAGGVLRLDLRPGTNFEQAQELARLLNLRVQAIRLQRS